MYITSVVSAKGGVAKSTTALSLSYLLGQQGKEVLLIDADPQNAITRHFIEGNSHKSVKDLLLRDSSVYESIQPSFPNVSLIASEIRLQMEMASSFDPHSVINFDPGGKKLFLLPLLDSIRLSSYGERVCLMQQLSATVIKFRISTV